MKKFVTVMSMVAFLTLGFGQLSAKGNQPASAREHCQFQCDMEFVQCEMSGEDRCEQLQRACYDICRSN